MLRALCVGSLVVGGEQRTARALSSATRRNAISHPPRIGFHGRHLRPVEELGHFWQSPAEVSFPSRAHQSPSLILFSSISTNTEIEENAVKDSSSGSANMAKGAIPSPTPQVLGSAWATQIQEIVSSTPQSVQNLERAISRTIPLLDNGDASAVPFVCRYRTEVIDPLTTKQVHALQRLVAQHTGLESLRKKLLEAMDLRKTENSIINRILASTSRKELDDLYAPYKPPAKNSVIETMRQKHPDLHVRLEKLLESENPPKISPSQLKPHDAAVLFVAHKIAADPVIGVVVVEQAQQHGRISTKMAAPSSSKDKSKDSEDKRHKYTTYADFTGRFASLRDHQVLAIRRGVDQKVLKLSYDLDADKMCKCISYHLRKNDNRALAALPRGFVDDSIKESWTRYLRRRATTRVWGDVCRVAHERSNDVFAQNLRRALLAPPLDANDRQILALDPGFRAGIKCAILDAKSGGKVIKLDTIEFIGPQRAQGLAKLEQLLTQISDKSDDKNCSVVVALGNGHGSQDARAIVQEASESAGVSIDIRLVTEAGASVWSVTEAAKAEFPKQSAAAVAAVSIGRRLINPLHELVKVPPRSLGLGQYQHDLSETELDTTLHATCMDCVATVGVDVNTCSADILTKVPGLTSRIASNVLSERPLQRRADLLSKVSGLGPKTFEHCAAFCRIYGGSEPLDETLVHPESYSLARHLLKTLGWKMTKKDNELPKDLPPRDEWATKWESEIKASAEKYEVSSERVLAVMDNLIESMSNVDPRLKEIEKENDDGNVAATSSSVGLIENCRDLPPEFLDMSKLETSIPLRGISGAIRNIVDFGAFVDFGGENDGLLHVSKLNNAVPLNSLLIGQQIGIDILDIDTKSGRTSLGLHGLNQSATPAKKSSTFNSVVKPPAHPRGSTSGGPKRSISTKSKGTSGAKRRITSSKSKTEGRPKKRRRA